MVWDSHLFQNFPQFIVIHTVKGFGIVNKAEIDAFLELSCFFHDTADVGNLISGSSAFSKTGLNIRKFTVHILLSSVKLHPTSYISPSTEDRAKCSSSLVITETQFTAMESNETMREIHQNDGTWKH